MIGLIGLIWMKLRSLSSSHEPFAKLYRNTDLYLIVICLFCLHLNLSLTFHWISFIFHRESHTPVEAAAKHELGPFIGISLGFKDTSACGLSRNQTCNLSSERRPHFNAPGKSKRRIFQSKSVIHSGLKRMRWIESPHYFIPGRLCDGRKKNSTNLCFSDSLQVETTEKHVMGGGRSFQLV